MTNFKRLFNASKFNFKFYTLQLGVFAALAVLNIIIAAIIAEGGSGCMDIMSFLWVSIVGAIGFFYYFKFLLINGFSRKNIFIICMAALLFLALCWTLLTFIFMIFINELNITMFNLFYLLFPQSNYGVLFLWLLFTTSAFALFGLFITLILYRAGKKVRWGLLAGVSLIVPLVFLINYASKGTFFKGLGKFFINIFGFAGTTPNPFIFIATMAVIMVICLGCSFLLIRKAQIKEI